MSMLVLENVNGEFYKGLGYSIYHNVCKIELNKHHDMWEISLKVKGYIKETLWYSLEWKTEQDIINQVLKDLHYKRSRYNIKLYKEYN